MGLSNFAGCSTGSPEVNHRKAAQEHSRGCEAAVKPNTREFAKSRSCAGNRGPSCASVPVDSRNTHQLCTGPWSVPQEAVKNPSNPHVSETGQTTTHSKI